MRAATCTYIMSAALVVMTSVAACSGPEDEDDDELWTRTYDGGATDYGYGVGGELPASTWYNAPYFNDGPASAHGHSTPYYSDGYGDF